MLFCFIPLQFHAILHHSTTIPCYFTPFHYNSMLFYTIPLQFHAFFYTIPLQFHAFFTPFHYNSMLFYTIPLQFHAFFLHHSTTIPCFFFYTIPLQFNAFFYTILLQFQVIHIYHDLREMFIIFWMTQQSFYWYHFHIPFFFVYVKLNF